MADKYSRIKLQFVDAKEPYIVLTIQPDEKKARQYRISLEMAAGLHKVLGSCIQDNHAAFLPALREILPQEVKKS